MKIANLNSTGEVQSALYCNGCGQPFGDLWKHSKVCPSFVRSNA